MSRVVSIGSKSHLPTFPCSGEVHDVHLALWRAIAWGTLWVGEYSCRDPSPWLQSNRYPTMLSFLPQFWQALTFLTTQELWGLLHDLVWNAPKWQNSCNLAKANGKCYPKEGVLELLLSLVVLIQLNMSQFDAADVLFVTGSRYSVCCNDKETGDVLFSLTAMFSLQMSLEVSQVIKLGL